MSQFKVGDTVRLKSGGLPVLPGPDPKAQS